MEQPPWDGLPYRTFVRLLKEAHGGKGGEGGTPEAEIGQYVSAEDTASRFSSAISARSRDAASFGSLFLARCSRSNLVWGATLKALFIKRPYLRI